MRIKNEQVDDIKRPEVPRIEVTTTIGCNVNCKYCPQTQFIRAYHKKSKVNNMSYELFISCVDKLPDNCEIVFGGFSECFLNDACTKMIRYAARKHSVWLYTTLIGINEMEVDNILSIPYKKCVVHIPDSEGYAKIPITASYKRILASFLQKKEDGRRIVSHLSCQGKPHPEIAEYAKGWYVLNYLENRCGLIEGDGIEKPLKHLTGSIICRHTGITMINHNMLFPDGTLGLCANDWTMKHVLGNLYEQDYETIMNGDARRTIREKMLLDEDNDIICRDCVHAKRIEDLAIDTWQTEKKNLNLLKK